MESSDRFDRIDRALEAMGQRFDSVDQRLEAVDQRLEAVDQRLEAVDQRFDAVDQRFDRMDQTIDRLLGLAMDHAKDIGQVQEGVKGLTVEVGRIHHTLHGVQEGFREHLTWHLGRE